MFGRSFFFVALLAASVVIPYVTASDPTKWFSGGSTPTAAASTDQAAAAPNANANNPAAPQPLAVKKGLAGLEGRPVNDLAEVIRFDATPAWVISRWSRVSTAAGDSDLQGYRVALVTGTREDDLAGSLTYYFNKQQRVQRLSFQGTTGDARRLVALLTSKYGFKRQTAEPSVHLYQVQWNGKPTSELQIKPARVVRADAAHARYEVAFVINNGG